MAGARSGINSLLEPSSLGHFERGFMTCVSDAEGSSLGTCSEVDLHVSCS